MTTLLDWFEERKTLDINFVDGDRLDIRQKGWFLDVAGVRTIHGDGRESPLTQDIPGLRSLFVFYRRFEIQST